MRFLGIAARWLLVLSLPLLLILGSLLAAINTNWLYTYNADKYQVRQTLAQYGLPLSDAELHRIYGELIRYYNSGEELVRITVNQNGQPVWLLTQEETLHFKDVKGLVRLGYGVAGGILAYVLAFAGLSLFWLRPRYRRSLARAILWGSGLTLAVMLILGLGSLLGFDSLFYQFHLVFFRNLYWSAQGYMLLLFPAGLQYSIAMVSFAVAAVLALVLGGVAGSYLLRIRTARVEPRTAD